MNGIGAGNGWATFVSRDLVHYVDAHYRTIASARGRGDRRASPRAATARSTSRSSIRASSRSSRAGRDTNGRTSCARSSGRTCSSSPRTIRGCSCGASAPRPAQARHLLLVLLRLDGSLPHAERGVRTRARRRCACRTRTGSSTAATTGRSGATTRASRISRRRRGSRMVRVARSVAAFALLARRARRRDGLALSRAARRCTSPGPGGARRARARRALAPRQHLHPHLPRRVGRRGGAARPRRLAGRAPSG